MYFSMLSPTATQDELVCTDPSLTVTSDNLVIKAMNLMRNKTGIATAYLDYYLSLIHI